MQSPSADRSKTLFFDHIFLPHGWARDVRVTISAGRIETITSSTTPQPGDERHACGLPGMANLHSHAFQRAMAGLTERRGPASDSFWTWRELMYRFVDRLNPEAIQAIAAQVYVEMLEAGFTRAGEFHYLHHDRGGAAYADPAATSAAIVEAAAQTGIGLTLLPVLYSHSGFGGQPPLPGQARFILDLDDYARLHGSASAHARRLPDALVGVAPHSLRAVTLEQLAPLAALAPKAPVHIHIAEQVKEVDDCLAWSGRRPVELLMDQGLLDPRWCLVHATHLTDAETSGIAQSGAVAGLCPITEANLGDGLFPLEAFLAADGKFGIGSDSNVLITMTEELRLLEYGQRLTTRARNVAAGSSDQSTGAALFAGAVAGGAQALGVAGGIATGNSADLVSLDLDHPALAHRAGDLLLDSLLFATSHGAIDCVWRHGEKVVSQGRHHQREATASAFKHVLANLLA